MKFAAVICSLLILVSCSRENFNKDNGENKQQAAEASAISQEACESSLSHEVSENEESSETERQESKDNYDNWALILVNPDNFIPNDFKVELKEVQGYSMDERIVSDYLDMYNGALKDNVQLLLCYGYRTKEQSQQLLDKQINRQMQMGLSYDNAVIEAKKWVAPPGTSDHHTGLALDIVTPSHQVLNHEFENTDAAIWLRDNAYKYGFIMRFPKGKEGITKITYEPWHYRYVGKNAAKYIYENQLCLEEFLEENER